MHAPSFWWRSPGIEAAVLAPFAGLYGAVAARRLRRDGKRASARVVCIGNPTVGGAGKTPTAIAFAHLLHAAGETPVFLTRGYGGRLSGPVQVGVALHSADIGDEPLLLAQHFPTIVARHRPSGANMAVTSGASVIVMDDGFQNPSLTKDVSVLVVDGRRGIGNGRVLPAGPLRAPLAEQLAKAHALLVVGHGNGAGPVQAAAQTRGLPIFFSELAPDRDACALLQATKVLAFAGIGDPDKFFATLDQAGIAVPVRRGFADHHRYTAAEATALLHEAAEHGLTLLTTEKDRARMQGDPSLAELRSRAKVLPVTLVLEDADAVQKFLLARLRRSA